MPAGGHHHARRPPRRAEPGEHRECVLRAGGAERACVRTRRGTSVIWVNTIIQGVLLGGLYALFACGLSLMFGVMKVINLAHGDLAVVAGYTAVFLAPQLHVAEVWSFVVVVPIFAV